MANKNLENTSIILHGQIRPETQDCIHSIESTFPYSEVIFCVSKSDKGFDSITIPDRYLILFYDDIPIFNDYGFASRNYLRQFGAVYLGVLKARNKYILKVRSDAIIQNISLPIIDDSIYHKLKYFHFSGKVRPVYVYPYYSNSTWYFYGDMIVFGCKEELMTLFKCDDKENDYANLSNTDILPCQIPSKRISFIAPEELLYISYAKKILSQNNNPLHFNDLLANNKEIVEMKDFVKALNIVCRLPQRIETYHRGIRPNIIRIIRRYCLLSRLYNWARGSA
jgi:hypothetical protein